MYLVVAALGAWFVAGALYYGWPEAGWHGTRGYALASLIVATAVSMGIHRYPRSAMGSLFAVDACALALLIAVIGSIVAASGKAGAVKNLGAGFVLSLGVGALASLLGNVILDEATAGLCVLAGSVTVLVVYLLSSVSGGVQGCNQGLLRPKEAGVLAVLLAAACTAVSLRWLGGFGVTLAAIGGLAALPRVHPALKVSRLLFSSRLSAISFQPSGTADVLKAES